MSTLTLDQIAPGSRINLRVVRRPTNTAASKTLMRLLSKDAHAQREIRRHQKIRKKHYDPQPRGGRLYAGHLVKQFPIKGELGESGTILATVPVLRDLKSVMTFIEVNTV
ncbi:MAG: hypothetical protein JJU36_10755 [Phycisphaeraceae bacterium]|nr:hypothetical protein [Phycisphaeraceae bacterium]